MVTFKLVEANTSDIPKIQELAQSIWITTFSKFFSGKELQQLFDGMYATDVLKETLANPDYTLFFICDNQHSKLGYCAIERKQTALKLDKIYVDPSKQGTGIGQAVMEEIYQMAELRGLKSVELRVNRAHSKSISFYKKQGFKIEKSINFPAPNGYKYEDYLMRKQI